MRVTLVFRTRRRSLTGQLHKETPTTYEIRYIDRDMKFRHVSIQKADIKEIRPLLSGLR